MLDPFCSQSSTEDLTENEISLCTPPHHQSLEERLVSAPTGELEELLEKVLEKRPELRSKLTKPKTSKPLAPPDQISWDDQLVDNREMYRDDRGGWVPAASVDNYKVVGRDFRDLPIVHIGKGRPNIRIIGLLQKNPNESETLDRDLCGVMSADDTTEKEDSQVMPSEGSSLESAAKPPRTSVRLQKKRIKSDEKLAELSDSEMKLQPATEMDTQTDNSNDLQGEEYVADGVVPPEMVSEVSIVSSQVQTRFECIDCYMQFGSPGSYRKHITSEQCKGFSFRCYLCRKSFHEPSQLQSHELHNCYQQIYVASPNSCLELWSSQRFRCSLCGKGHQLEEEVITHSRLSHSSAPAFQCKSCGRSFHELRALQNHFTKHHLKSKLTCAICNKHLSSKHTLQTHMKYAHSEDKPVLKCPLCGKVLMSKKSLAHHMSSIHENNRPFKCEFCDKAFVTKSTLDIHKKAHKDTRDFICGICGAAFLQKVRLTEHVRAHSGVREFSCAICSKSFYSKKDLTSHEKIHSKVKSYICEPCGNAYSQVQSLKKHMITHNAIPQSFKCQFCIKTFKSTGAVYKHCRMLHQDRLTAYCSLCCLRFVSEADLNRHNHYKHIAMYDGRAEEKSFLSSTTELTEDITHRDVVGDTEATCSYQCMCGDAFADVNKLAEHIQASHPAGEADEMMYTTTRSTSEPMVEESEPLVQPALVDELVTDQHSEGDINYVQEETVIIQHGTDCAPEVTRSVAGLLYDADSSSQPRTQVFQLSTAATGLTEIQHLFTEQQQH